MTPTPPPGYELLERLGQGFGGAVYRGVRSRDQARVAIKVLTAEPDSPEYLEKRARLVREAEICARVKHPALVPLLAAAVEPPAPYLVFALLEGGDLAQRIEAGPRLTPAEVQRLGVRLAGGLASLHAAQVTHRDLKPANIFLAADGTPYLGDLGPGT